MDHTPGTPQVLRAMNDRAALDALLAEGPLTRAGVGRITGLSKPTASQLLGRLEAAGLVEVAGTSSGSPGPGAQLYALNPRRAHVAGLDVTADGTRAAVADLTGRVVGRYQLDAPQGADTARHVAGAVDGALHDAGLTRRELHRVVVATPGAFDPGSGRLRYAAHLPGWHDPAVIDAVAAALALPVAYENDVNLAAVAEQELGVARGRGDFVLLWNGTGIGGALVIGGRLHRGFTGGAGEFGFLPVPGTPVVRKVAEADRGGFQDLAGAPGVVSHAHSLGLDVPQGRPADAAAALLARAAEDPGAPRHAALLQRHATSLALGLASVVAVLDPGLIVLSGPLNTAGGEPLRELVAAELADLAAPRPEVAVAGVRGDPVLRGALEAALRTTRDEVFDTSR
ncbi:N-acetylglucosamine repressor [Streptomyces sp. RB5]|uniref:N-acetylglucosamine repressor n=1 Tax=Streptomyces smaragdinus TaxID=2585196 RepID=A0A7K0CNN0_9ACTN|nr:ROK family transcriptional regulator [Streptomyces smaragdinus]MQY15090.1 N-acetylglucosamine repressor [Streptomyces smaragdinus]